ncbi:MAG: hypothetical protein R3E96_03085 [Planctomycetota bacterium]
MPNGQFGFFLMGQTQGFVANPGGSLGNLCLGGSIGRLNQIILNSGAAGLVSTPVDLIQMPTPSTPGRVIGGQTWNFQCWYRDWWAVGVELLRRLLRAVPIFPVRCSAPAGSELVG